MIQVTDAIVLDPRDIEEHFILAGGPGGQNVNKVATAVELRFRLHGASDLSDALRARLARLAGRRLNREGVLVLVSRRHRTQERNRAAARAALIGLVRRAAISPVKRIRTAPTAGMKARRLENKARRGALKRQRRAPPDDG